MDGIGTRESDGRMEIAVLSAIRMSSQNAKLLAILMKDDFTFHEFVYIIIN